MRCGTTVVCEHFIIGRRLLCHVALHCIMLSSQESSEDALLRRVVEAATGLKATELMSKGTVQGDRGTGGGWEVRLPR